MKKKLKILSRRALACFLSVMLCVSMIQITAFADETPPAPSGGEGETEPTPVEPDPAPKAEDQDAGTEAGGEPAQAPADVEVKVDFGEDGAPIVDVTGRPEAEPGTTVDYAGTIEDENGDPVKTPDGEDAQLTGSVTNTPGDTKTDPEDPDRVTEGSSEIKNEEKTDPIPVEPKPEEKPVDPEPEEKPVEGLQPGEGVEVEVKPEEDPVTGEIKGEGTFGATDDQLDKIKAEELDKLNESLKAPEDLAETTVTEENKTTVTSGTWNKTEIKDGDKLLGYKTEEVRTVVETVTGLPAPSLTPPAEDKENGITVEVAEDGQSYTVTTVWKDENGVEITKKETVANGTMTVVTTTVTTTTRDHTVVVAPGKDGTITVTVDGVESTVGKVETGGLEPMESKGTPYKIDASNLNIRKEPSSTSASEGKLNKGDIIYVVEEKIVDNDLWGKTVNGQWVCLKKGDQKAAYAGEEYKVTANTLKVRKGAGTSHPQVGTVKKGEAVFIYEVKDGWGRISRTEDKWVSLGYADQVGPSDLTPADGKTDPDTDLYGWKDQYGNVTTTPGRPNDNYNTTGMLYQVEGKELLQGINPKTGKLEPLGRLDEDKGGLIFVSEVKVINGVEYGIVGENTYGNSIVIPMSKLTAPKAEEGEFLFYGEYGLSSSVGVNIVNGTDKNGDPVRLYNVHQMVITDADGKKHYVYCADLSVHPTNGVDYGMVNVEDVGYLKEYADQVSAIAGNGYWGTSEGTGSMESFKQWLVDIGAAEETKDLSWMTPGLAMSLTQASIWHFSNSAKADPNKENPIAVNEGNPFENKYYGSSATADELKKLTELYKFLTDDQNAETLKEHNKLQATDLVTEEDVKDVTVTVKNTAAIDKTETYEADISFVLDVEPTSIGDDMKVTVKQNGKVLNSYLLKDATARGAEGNTYTIRVEGLDGKTTLDIQISGTQKLEKAAYLITAQGGYTESQTFVSVEEGTRVYNLDVKLDLEVQTATATVTTKVESEVSKTQQTDREWSSTLGATYTYKDPEEPPTPVEPEDPKDPEDPGDPDDPDPRDPDDPDDPDDPTPPGPTPRTPRTPDDPAPVTYIEIPDEPTPLSNFPGAPVEELIEIPDEEVPLAGLPGEPGTGIVSHRTLWATIFMASLAGLFLLYRKDEEEAA